jgi:hypothetical protein
VAKADPQKRRIYAWEHAWADWNRTTCTLREARAVVHWACGKYGIRPPAVKQHHTMAYSESQGHPVNIISFRARDQINPAVALHEAAHHICGAIFGEDTDMADHSPEFMGVYLWLLEGYRVAPRTALHASARARGIRWVPTWVVSPKRLQRRRAA